MTRAEVMALQQALGVRVDGIYGPITQAAHRAHLDAADTTPVPTLTPAPAKPWWTSRAVLGLLASVLAMLAGRLGWEIADDQITALLLQAVELGGLAVAAWGTVRRRGAIDPTLVARLPGGNDVRLPVRAIRQSPPGNDPRGVFRDY
jgi:hypothetical protein